MPHMSGSVVMNELSIMYHRSRSFCCFWLMIEKSVAPLSPTVNDPNSVKMFGSGIPDCSQKCLIWDTISSAIYS